MFFASEDRKADLKLFPRFPPPHIAVVGHLPIDILCPCVEESCSVALRINSAALIQLKKIIITLLSLVLSRLKR